MLALVGNSSRHFLGLCRLNTRPVSWDVCSLGSEVSLELGVLVARYKTMSVAFRQHS